jgi:hypothetical protein
MHIRSEVLVPSNGWLTVLSCLNTNRKCLGLTPGVLVTQLTEPTKPYWRLMQDPHT